MFYTVITLKLTDMLSPIPFQPMKFMTTKCKITCAKMKSANARSGDRPLKSDLFLGLVWIRKQTEIKQKHIKTIEMSNEFEKVTKMQKLN